MTTKPKRWIDLPELGLNIATLRGLRQAKKTFEENESLCAGKAKEQLEDLGLGKYNCLDVEGGVYTFSYIEGKRSSLSKDLLLEAGVDPAIVEKCMKETKYRYIGEIKYEPAWSNSAVCQASI